MLLYENFYFAEYRFKSFRHSDNSSGVPRHFLAYMKKGRGELVSEKKTVVINEGEVFYIPKGLKYHSYWYGSEDICFISLGFNSLDIKGNFKYEVQTVPTTPHLAAIVESVPTVCGRIDCNALSRFYAAMAEVIPLLEKSPESRDEQRVERVKELIFQNPGESISRIAEMCSVSEPHLYTVFKKVTGITPNVYRQQMLCRRAVEMLITTDERIEWISDTLGFSSSSYFRKILKQYTGKTPRQIRKEQF